jgi:hypothetical protein
MWHHGKTSRDKMRQNVAHGKMYLWSWHFGQKSVNHPTSTLLGTGLLKGHLNVTRILCRTTSRDIVSDHVARQGFQCCGKNISQRKHNLMSDIHSFIRANVQTSYAPPPFLNTIKTSRNYLRKGERITSRHKYIGTVTWHFFSKIDCVSVTSELSRDLSFQNFKKEDHSRVS